MESKLQYVCILQVAQNNYFKCVKLPYISHEKLNIIVSSFRREGVSDRVLQVTVYGALGEKY